MPKRPFLLILARADGVSEHGTHCLIRVSDEFELDRQAALDLFKTPRYAGIIDQVALHGHHYVTFGSYCGIEEALDEERQAIFDSNGSVVYSDAAEIESILSAVEKDEHDTHTEAPTSSVRLVFAEGDFHVTALDSGMDSALSTDRIGYDFLEPAVAA